MISYQSVALRGSKSMQERCMWKTVDFFFASVGSACIGLHVKVLRGS